ncbi:TOTE conflict system archaeo-eukaryotic primase domain-containing protein [Neobacillus cucumis]|uniref:TOTE conflict system archaeo-eukaryotic primase domain-containing protein n=1 Tax=Neobacillus cucumis TaxID=1740721 RepID=UPI001FDD184A|nr:DEAD/DEAH box helicase family protein [Neobacillus cucumis]MBM7653464.1 superfamily II DNA or RNA helicase [Neobacillus cucumis]
MEFERLLKELEHLRKENDYLKHLLSNMMHQRDEKIELFEKEKKISNRSLPKEKIQLFKSLFKGRSDVFANRWESKDGRSGYTPSCDLEWQKPICQKPKIKCSECVHRKLSPLTNQELFNHLSGAKTVGLYPLLQDETCFFIAVDFDKQNWKQDVLAFVNECKCSKVPAYVERSRSGNGAHVWIFFSEKIPAALARKLGTYLLTKSLEKRHQIGMDSFDRMFPNQDTLPRGGFGNLIALPLQLHSKNNGNSVFVDEHFIPYPDQWLFLSSIAKISKLDILSVIDTPNQTQVKEDLMPMPIPEKIKVYMKNGIFIKKQGIPSFIFSKIMSLATFKNPEFYKAQAKRMSTYGMQRSISSFEEDSEYLILPRGCFEELQKLLTEHSIEIDIADESYDGENIQVNFSGQLTSQQQEALTELLKHKNGTLVAATGFGKTVTAASLIAKRKTNTLIIVNRTQLLQQWIESLSTFLQVPEKGIGQIGGGKSKITGQIDVATIQSLNFKGKLKSFITQYGQIIVDECHHISAFSFEKVLKQVRAKYVYGLTATPIRKDGLHPIIFMQCGQIRYKTNAKSQAKIRPFNHKLIPRYTNLKSDSTDINEIYRLLSTNEYRNQLLFDDVLNELDKGRSPIILTERIEHLENLRNLFNRFAKNIIVLSGNMTKKEQRNELTRLAKIPDNEERLVIAIGKYIGEGFDDPRLDTLFLAMPISWKGTLQQYVGRLHRIHADKQEVKVYDYVDVHVPTLKAMFEKRLNGYKSMGYVSEENKQIDTNEQMQLF